MGEGSFSADSPFCRAGTFTEANGRFVGTREVAFERKMTCRDGSGTATALVQQTILFDPSGSGRWQITSATGAYRALRGQGTSTLTAIDLNDYRETWKGVADLDDIAPSVRIERLSASRLRKPGGSYLLKIGFSALDNVRENAVSYEAEVTSGALVKTRAGTVSGGKATLSLRLTPGARTRSARVRIKVSDPLGNTRSTARSVRLPRSR